MRPLDTFKMRHFLCECGEKLSDLKWGKDDLPTCIGCGGTMFEVSHPSDNKAPAVHGDEIDIWIRHGDGIINPDGTPKRYRSKTELKRVAYEAGYSVYGDTPTPNPRIVESRKREEEARSRR